MNCLEFRRALGADPNHASPESLAHRGQCPTCEKYALEMRRLDGLIKRALEISMQADKRTRRAPAIRRYAMAASLLLVVGIGGALWMLGYPEPSLASEVIHHMAHEPDAMRASTARVATELLDGALRAKGFHLTHPIANVSYLQSCPLRGDLIPHLVVQTDRGPVTVLLFAKETVTSNQHFDEQQYHGMLVPMEHGSIAVIANDATLIEGVANTIKASVSFTHELRD